MSWLSEFTGVHVSPHGVSLSAPHPLGAIKDAVSNPLFDAGLALAIPGLGGAIGGALSSIPGASAVGTALSHLPGASAIGSALGLGGGSAGAAGAASAIPDAAMGLPEAANTGGAGAGGFLSQAGHFLTGNGGKNALGIAQGINAALQQKQANDYAKQALGGVEASYAQRAPLRAQGVSLMQQSQVGNPYATGQPTAPLRIGG